MTKGQELRQNPPRYFFVSLRTQMLVIRLQRAGRKNHPFYRIVVAEKSKPVKGRFLERVGHYNPLVKPKELVLNKERIEHWISMGATPSQTAARMFTKNGISAAEKFIENRKMKPSKAEVEAAEKSKQEAEEKAKAEEEAKAAAAAEAEAKAAEEAAAVEEKAEEKEADKKEEKA